MLLSHLTRYYPYHYAPFLSDIRNISGLKLTFELGKPFMPFQQLLAVLPSASRELLPESYRVIETHKCFHSSMYKCTDILILQCVDVESYYTNTVLVENFYSLFH